MRVKVKVLVAEHGAKRSIQMDSIEPAIDFCELPTDDYYIYGAELDNGERFENPDPISGGPQAVAKWLKSKAA
jgi:hypothetical protein